MAKHEKPRFGSAKELFAKVGSEKPAGLRFTGMIRPGEDDGFIHFARTGDCSQWISLPVDRIDDVEVIRWVHCGQDQYPQVHISMKNPRTPEGGAFAELAMLHHQSEKAMAGTPGPAPCYYDFKLNRIICP